MIKRSQVRDETTISFSFLFTESKTSQQSVKEYLVRGEEVVTSADWVHELLHRFTWFRLHKDNHVISCHGRISPFHFRISHEFNVQSARLRSYITWNNYLWECVLQEVKSLPSGQIECRNFSVSSCSLGHSLSSVGDHLAECRSECRSQKSEIWQTLSTCTSASHWHSSK